MQNAAERGLAVLSYVGWVFAHLGAATVGDG